MSSLYKTQTGAQVIAQRYREFLKFWPQPNRQFHVATRFGETFVAKDVILDSAETKTRLERTVPHAAIRYLPDLGHGVFGERAAILEFLASPTLAA